MQLIRVVHDGRPVWVEAAPAACPEGHYRLGATWAPCPDDDCRRMCRQWRCLEGGCKQRLIDPDHEHRGGPVPPGVQPAG